MDTTKPDILLSTGRRIARRQLPTGAWQAYPIDDPGAELTNQEWAEFCGHVARANVGAPGVSDRLVKRRVENDVVVEATVALANLLWNDPDREMRLAEMHKAKPRLVYASTIFRSSLCKVE